MRKLKKYKHTRFGDKAMKESFNKTVYSFFPGTRLVIPFVDEKQRLGHFSIKHEDIVKAIYKLWKKY